MSSKVVGTLVATALLIVAGATAASAADLDGSSVTVRSSSRSIGTRHRLGFWGENFPYGYR